MTRSIIGRAAVCSGALVLAVGAGCIVAPAAEAASTSGLVPTVTTTVTDLTGGAGSGAGSSGTGLVPTATTTVIDLTGGAGSGAGGSSGTSGAGSSGTSGAGSSGTSAVSTVADTATDLTGGGANGIGGSGTGLVPTATTTVTDLTGGTGSSSSSGSGGGSDSGSGGISVAVGQTGDGGSLVSVGLGGQRFGGAGGSGSTGGAGANGSDGADGADGVSVVVPSTPVPSTPTPSTPVSSTPVESDLLGLQLRPSVATVYPVKDGYRDGVAFTLAGLTADGQPRAIQGVAVLSRGTKAVKRWNLQRSDQVLRWNGRTGTRIVSGAYRLVVAARDAEGHSFSAATSVAVSAKRLVASTRALEALAISGTHRMDPAPRGGLSRGRVTVRVTTTASKVQGAQKLVFEHGRKRIVVPVRQGTHTSRAITVPKEFTSFRIRHTWKKGQVALQSVRYIYSYQALK